MAGFQTSVAQNPGYGIPGDFGTTGPWTSVPAGPGELTAGASGVTIAAFAWADDLTGIVTNAKPASGATRFGFVGRDQRSAITTYLAESSFLINPGMEVTLYTAGEFMVKAVAAVTIGQKAFASTTDGSITFAAAGATVTGSVETKFYAWTAGAAGDIVIISDKGF